MHYFKILQHNTCPVEGAVSLSDSRVINLHNPLALSDSVTEIL